MLPTSSPSEGDLMLEEHDGTTVAVKTDENEVLVAPGSAVAPSLVPVKLTSVECGKLLDDSKQQYQAMLLSMQHQSRLYEPVRIDEAVTSVNQLTLKLVRYTSLCHCSWPPLAWSVCLIVEKRTVMSTFSK